MPLTLALHGTKQKNLFLHHAKNGKKGKHVNTGQNAGQRGTRFLGDGLVVLFDDFELVLNVGAALVEDLELVDCRLRGNVLGPGVDEAHVNDTSHCCSSGVYYEFLVNVNFSLV